MAISSFRFDLFAFQTSLQAVIFLLQMVGMVLQFGHLSRLFFLLCLYILMTSKELVFQGLNHWVSGHGDKTQLFGGVIGNYQSFRGWEIT